MRKLLWHLHPGVRSGDELTLGERAADKIRSYMGSWPFVFSFFLFMFLWMLLNVGALFSQWDPYPYILLNLMLSMMAGLQGAVLIISGKRGEQIQSELALHDFKINQETLERIVKIEQLLSSRVEHIVDVVEDISADNSPEPGETQG